MHSDDLKPAITNLNSRYFNEMYVWFQTKMFKNENKMSTHAWLKFLFLNKVTI